jgi:hypothetical protein
MHVTVKLYRIVNADPPSYHEGGPGLKISCPNMSVLSLVGAIIYSGIASPSSAQDNAPSVTLVPNTTTELGVHPDYPNAKVMPLPSISEGPGTPEPGNPQDGADRGAAGSIGTGTTSPVIIVPR